MMRLALAAVSLVCSAMLMGCVVVGYSNSGGWFVWPRGLGVVLAILFVVLLLRRRR